MELVVNGNTLLTYEFNGEQRKIKFSDLSQYWEYANEDDFESGTVEENEDYIIGTMTTASGQVGIIYVWNKLENKLAHISDGAFAVSAALADNSVYLLCAISSWGKKESFMVTKAPFGTMNPAEEGKNVAKDIEGIEWNGSLDDIKLSIDDSKVEIVCCGNKVVLQSVSKLYKLVGVDGKMYESTIPGTLGGHKRLKIYGRLDCPSALRYIAKGQYVKHRVFFKDEETAIAAGYRPCKICMPEKYAEWKQNH